MKTVSEGELRMQGYVLLHPVKGVTIIHLPINKSNDGTTSTTTITSAATISNNKGSTYVRASATGSTAIKTTSTIAEDESTGSTIVVPLHNNDIDIHSFSSQRSREVHDTGTSIATSTTANNNDNAVEVPHLEVETTSTTLSMIEPKVEIRPLKILVLSPSGCDSIRYAIGMISDTISLVVCFFYYFHAITCLYAN